ncbi:unnamed protein product [Symbiodinium sp. CCMP2592]|nr:unnamed protein product [Symbiodinium sp. CCMP2592]
MVQEAVGIDVDKPWLFSCKVALSVMTKTFATVSHGLMAVKWILAGEPASSALVACFVLVAVNTQMLVTVAQVAHLRDVLLKLGTSKRVRVAFLGIGSLLEVGAGRTCVAVNLAATVCLVAHLHERLVQLLPWLVTAFGTLMWANSTFLGVGVSEWKDIKSFANDDCEVVPAAEFLAKLGAEGESEGQCTFSQTFCGLHKEDKMLLQSQPLLLQHAFPEHPKVRLLHNLMMAVFSLFCFAVPASLLGLCMAQVPLLQDMELAHSSLHPPFKPDVSDYFIRLEDGWMEGISMSFQLGVGKASSFAFCCVSGCKAVEGTEHGDSVLLKAYMSKEDIGTCQLKLFGLRFHQHEFTALALQGLEIESHLGGESGSFEPFGAGWRVYSTSFVSESSAPLSLHVAPKLGTKNVQVAYTSSWCANSTCHDEPYSAVNGSIDIKKVTEVGSFNLTVQITLSPSSSEPALSSVYQVSVIIVDLKLKLEELALKMSELEAKVDSLADFDSADEATKLELQNATDERNQYLVAAKRLQTAKVKFEFMNTPLTFLTVGLTGAGKSELCTWMTGNLEECNPSGTMRSNTSKVKEVKAHPFDDILMKPDLNWIDTPGRGDTRGEGNDSAMWDETMSYLISRSGHSSVDRIVWVINAAWQRATAGRKLVLHELRKSFGIYLYRNLDLVFNFLFLHYDSEILWPQRQKFIDWIQEQEFELFNWSNSSKTWRGVQEEINRTGFYGVSIHPRYMKTLKEEIPADLRLSSPYLYRFRPFSHPAGIRELLRLYKTARQLRKKKVPGIKLSNKHPPIGPGVLQGMDASSYTCGLLPDPVDYTRMVLGISTVNVRLTGKFFSEDDRAALVPIAQECGEPASGEGSRWIRATGEPAAGSVQETSEGDVAEYRVPNFWPSNPLKVCFCEAPRCVEPWRFGQTAPQTLPAPEMSKSCSSAAYVKDVDVARQGELPSWASWSRVGNQLFAIPWHYNDVLVMDLDTENVSFIPTSFPRKVPHNTLTGLGLSAAVVKECIYAAPVLSAADALLIVNTSSRQTDFFPVSRFCYRGELCRFSSIVAVGTVLHLLPNSPFGSLVRMNVGRDPLAVLTSVPIPASIKGCMLPSTFAANDVSFMWLGMTAVNDTLYAAPFDAECLLIYHAGNQSFEGIDTSTVGTGAMKWAQLLEANGRLYAAPGRGRTTMPILVVDLATRQPRGVPASSSAGWPSIARHGHQIYVVSCKIAVLDLEADSSVRYFRVAEEGASYCFTDAIVANQRLYLLPDVANRISVLDFKPRPVQLSHNNTALRPD